MREQYGGGANGSGPSGLGDVGASPAVASGNDDGHDGHDDEVEIQPATAGGFLAGVEDVVRPYSLPRPVHVVFSSPPRSPNTSGRASPSPALAGSGTLFAPIDVDTGEEHAQVSPPFSDEVVEDSEVDRMSGLEELDAHSHQRVRRIPKSMAALAAEAAEAEARHPAAAVDVGKQATSTTRLRISRTAVHPTPRTKTRETQTRSETRTKSKTRTEMEIETETKSRSKTGARARAKAKAKTTTAGTTPSRKRARTQDDGDDDGESASGRVGSEPGSDGGERVSIGRPRVAKRARKHRQGSRADGDVDGDGEGPVPVHPSDRVLRTRKGKSPALLAQEREEELAVQRALAG